MGSSSIGKDKEAPMSVAKRRWRSLSACIDTSCDVVVIFIISDYGEPRWAIKRVIRQLNVAQVKVLTIPYRASHENIFYLLNEKWIIVLQERLKARELRMSFPIDSSSGLLGRGDELSYYVYLPLIVIRSIFS